MNENELILEHDHVVCYYSMILTHKQLEIDWYILSTVDTDVLVLKHQHISIHCWLNIRCIGPDSYREIWVIENTIMKWNYTWKNTQLFML